MSEASRPQIKDYKDLQVWQKGMDLARRVYLLTRSFPVDEKFGLISQMRHAAVSVPSNIAEGQARNTTGEFVQFISPAEGSLAELDTQLRLATVLKFCAESQANALSASITELQRMLKSLRGKLTTDH